ncbi:MAG: hypothetical protein KDI22_06500 [Gammaproteobacteria bacterium]|nr:hypothetical protein [Gammaproteobacteria bacterium]MCP5318271.1 hypothetical protein [Chromatiaceae bacterium]MCW5584518.1 hypothetical protein [Chromatiales bacterium]MCB1817437.1 hypothetical protein [Gammaproteobacteria bacterium]MCP5430584.1 hypothetical protein [Chromatiaceae bacterium]
MNTIRKGFAALTLATIGFTGHVSAHDQGPGGHARHHGSAQGVVTVICRDALPGDPRVIGRQERQQQRIDNGWRSGELTRDELQRLDAQQARIADMARRFSADGRLTPAERLELERVQDRASVDIARTKHNDNDRHRLYTQWAVVYRDL